ncbi:MAG: ubiquinone/menaquinone biosynthesis C-methylase UbiE [Polaribacter sp.]|jgi:ubiquinone/menaquinone biosynthesis C-methylase UbiE|tara:strand:+ start:23079 stop:23861 length:783 start_codon:yes stop_codon:yes gene_type:complete
MSSFFDGVAKTYDHTFTNTKIGREQRKKVYKSISHIFFSEEKVNVLELNCGTGVDAIAFAKKGHSIIATDISEEMINVANKKNSYNNLIFKVLDCKKLTSDSFEKEFDVVFSNFGGLNCLSLDELKILIQGVYEILKPGGKLVMVLMPKNCIWEQLYFSFKGRFKKAQRRKTNNSLLVNVNRVAVPTWYFNPKEIIKASNENFTTTKCFPIGITVPPSYLEKSFLTKKPIWNILKMIEKNLSNRFLAKYADHFLIELTKK